MNPLVKKKIQNPFYSKKTGKKEKLTPNNLENLSFIIYPKV
jgi:hypothetical protein